MSEETLPVMDDAHSDGPSEQELLDAVMRNSAIMEEAGAVPPPTEEVIDEDPVEDSDEDPAEDEIVTEENEEEYEEEVAGAEGEDDTSTQEPEVFTMDDLDLDASVTVKIDGEEMDVSFGDLIKGYTTEQSLSKKGRELGEERKKIEEERVERLGQLDQIAQAGSALLMQSEQSLAKQYHDLEEQIKKAREDGDTFELGELKDKRELAQQQYWNARRQREGLLNKVQEEAQKTAQEQWDKQIQHFQETIPTMIPDFNEEVAGSIREFAIGEGIDPNILDTITDPSIVKFVDDYRRLKQGVSKGQAKRKAAPTKKVPAKRTRSPQKKSQDKAKNLRAKVLSGQGNETDEMNFLRNFANQSLNGV